MIKYGSRDFTCKFKLIQSEEIEYTHTIHDSETFKELHLKYLDKENNRIMTLRINCMKKTDKNHR